MGYLIIVIGIVIFLSIPLLDWLERCNKQKEDRTRAEENERKIAEKSNEEFQRLIEEINQNAKELNRLHLERLDNDPEYRRQYEEKQAKAHKKEEEERRRKDEARRKALADKFKYTSIAGFKAAYRFDYYPVNRFPHGTIPSADENARKNIWKFKDGAYSIGANIAADFIDGNFTREEMANIALCVIPASSRAKNEVRYRSMCEQVAERLPIINGFSYISITADREDTRTSGKSSDTTAFLAFSSDIQGKDIVLFDDVTTRGTSFAQAAVELKRRGAKSVYGLFIGKTV